jgi:hypothetical protein
VRTLFAALLCLASGCTADPGSGGEQDLSTGGGGEDLATEVPPDFARPPCPSQVLCGPSATCCAAGDDCVDDACVPACASGVRCAAGCCNAGEVCLAAACAVPGMPCADSLDCPEGQFCEPTLGKCLPQPGGAGDGGGAPLCEYRPPVLPYQPTPGWSWTGSTIQPTHNQVINMPVVIDLDKDTIPDVVIVTSNNYDNGGIAYLRALDGKTGLEKWPATAGVYEDANRVAPRGTPAAADLEGDGTIQIVAFKSGGGLIAFNADGSFRWRSKLADGTTDYNQLFNSGTIAIADMDHDGKGEIVAGGVVFDHTGKMISGLGRHLAGTNAASYGAVSIVADVNDDDELDVVTGRAAWKLDGTAIWDCGVSPFCGFGAAPTDGYPAISDLDRDGVPELVVISRDQVRVQNARTGARLAVRDMPGSGNGGPPTIADFDGDRVMDISSANGTSYNVFGYTSTPAPALSDKWQSATQDGSSNVTGSSVFDFEGDGKAEVVYNDECYMRVYRGSDGMVLFQTPSSSATIHEYPVLVDVDGDNRTEILVTSNDLNHLGGTVTCAGYGANDRPRHGVFTYRDVNNKWVRTRKLWNQHAYHITNILSDGKLPNPEPDSWVPPVGFNNYRVSTQGSGVYNAPDLAVDVELSTATCPDGITIRARVKNLGSLGVPAGVKVDFYLGPDATGTHLGTRLTTVPLLPGASERIDLVWPVSGPPPYTFHVVVDGTAGSSSAFDECNEGNNDASTPAVACPLIG